MRALGREQIQAISPLAFTNMPVNTLLAFSEAQLRALTSTQIVALQASDAYVNGGAQLDNFRTLITSIVLQTTLAAAGSIVSPSASDSIIFKLNIILFIACLIKSIAF